MTSHTPRSLDCRWSVVTRKASWSTIMTSELSTLVPLSKSSCHVFLVPEATRWCSLSKEQVDFLEEDLLHLLSLTHTSFWSTLIHNREAVELVTHTLQLLPRDHDLVEDDVIDSFKVSQLFFLVLLRVCSRKDSRAIRKKRASGERRLTTEEEEVTTWSVEEYSCLLRNQRLLNISFIIDSSSLLASLNRTLASRMIENLFQFHSTLVTHDLAKCIRAFNAYLSNDLILAIDNISAFNPDVKGLKRLVLDTTEVLVSIKNFCDIHNNALNHFFEADFSRSLAIVYQQVLLPLSNILSKHSDISDLIREALSLRLQYARKSSILLLRSMLEKCAIASLLEEKKGEDDKGYLDAISACMEEGGAILLDLDKYFRLQEDFEVLQTRRDVDQTRLEYIKDGVRQLTIDLDHKMSSHLARREANTALEIEREHAALKKASNGTNELVNRVKDLLPDLDVSFVERCLQYFDNDPEKVVNALFEDNLPPHLREQQQQEEGQQDEGQQEELNENADEKLNHNEEDKLIVVETWRGKRPRPRDAKSLLDDKSEVMAMRDKMVELDAEYEDEYDDTYDDNLTGQAEPDEEPVQQPLLTSSRYRKRDDDNDNEDEENDGRSRRNEAFVRDPAQVRAEAERRRQQQQQRRHGGGQPQPQQRDVVGRAKGQGQEKQVLINRARKNANKGKANRSRNEAKMGKGMY